MGNASAKYVQFMKEYTLAMNSCYELKIHCYVIYYRYGNIKGLVTNW